MEKQKKEKIALRSLTIGLSVLSIISISATNAIENNRSNTYTFVKWNKDSNSTNTDLKTINTKYENMNSIVNLFLKKNKFNENSKLFKSILNNEINKIKNSKNYLDTLINKKVNDNEFILVYNLLNKLKNELSTTKSLKKDESITKVENSNNGMNEDKYCNFYYVVQRPGSGYWAGGVYHALWYTPQRYNNSQNYNQSTSNSNNSSIWNNNVDDESTKQILQNTINNLQNLSNSLNTQADVIMGIGGSIALVLAILGVFDFGTTVAIAIAIATVFNTVISGAFGQVINSLNSLVQQIQSTLNTDDDLTVLSSSLTQTYKLIQLCISQLNNAINNLESYTWVVGV
ncbi:MAG: sulfite exporter TauE/SafE family protein, partial [Mycoplasmataceae bacterium]|nr:sulfite exporter TauE/SafE family protein [Mycoplasmataceae bacterium]